MKAHTTLSIDPDIIKMAKAAGLNMSQIFQEALEAHIGSEKPETLAVKLSMERRNINADIDTLKLKKQEIEERATLIFGTTLDDFLVQQNIEVLDQTEQAIEAIIKRITSGRHDWTIEKLNSVYNNVLISDYGIKQHETIRICREAHERVHTSTGGLYQ
jgi:cell division protein FtsB